MKTCIQTKTLTARDSHLLPYANALVTYAETDVDFAHALAQAVSEQGFIVRPSSFTSHTSPVVITEQSEATTLACWVINECDQNTPVTQSVLATFSKNHESPKDVVIGIVGLAIIGPTLGIINKKKQKSHLQILVDKSFAKTLTPEKLAQTTNESGQTLMSKELRLAGGNITRLHPDSAEWMMNDPATKVSVVEQTTLTNAANVIENEKLSGHIKHGSGRIDMILVSPAVPDEVINDIE